MKHRIIPCAGRPFGSFGEIVPTKSQGILIPGGLIFLKNGKHLGVNRGFGAEHIWAAHETEMRKAGFAQKKDVAAYVATIVRPGSAVFCEFARLGRFQRLAVVRSAAGLAVLEFIGEEESGHYSIITAYDKKQADGSRIGTVR